MDVNIETKKSTGKSKINPFRKRISTFDFLNYSFLSILGTLMIFPLLHVFAGSLSSEYAIASGKVSIFPVEFNLDSYKYILSDFSLWRSLFVTIYITVVGTFFALLTTTLLAYPLSKPRVKARRWILLAIVFVMIFGVPTIPFFLTVRNTGLLDSLNSLIIPSLVNPFNLLVLKTFFENVPAEMEESAKIDGANDLQVLYHIFVPLALPALATIALFYAVEKWNGYYHALMFISDNGLYPLQVKANMMFSDEEQSGFIEGIGYLNREGIKYAVIIFAVVPILMVYPFLQKFFAKGVMIGGVKG